MLVKTKKLDDRSIETALIECPVLLLTSATSSPTLRAYWSGC